jgi:hypothetical protein
MPLLAVATTTADRLKEIPGDFWWKMLLAIIAFIAVIFFLRKVAKMNKVMLAVVSVILLTTVGFNWIFERNEPAWATPVVAFLSGFFPTKGAAVATKPPPLKAPATAPVAAKRS